MLAWWIMLSNAVDLVLTMWGLRLRVIWEGNPLFAALLEANPALAGALKMATALAGVMILYWAYPRSPRLVGVGVLLVGTGMALVLSLHARWILAVLPAGG